MPLIFNRDFLLSEYHVSQVGELIGGSQREERLDVLKERCNYPALLTELLCILFIAASCMNALLSEYLLSASASTI
jgi:hypothetical protein